VPPAIGIRPNESFPNESHLTPQWHGFLEHMQEREIETRWVPDRRFPEKTFQQFQTNHPNEAKQWTDTQVTAFKREREQGVTSWLESRTLAQKESLGRDPLAPTFADHAAETVFNNLQYTGMWYAVAPDRSDPATDAVVAEVRRRAADPGGLVRDVLNTAGTEVNAFLGPVDRELNDLATALDKWSDALATDSSPNGDTLTQLATVCRDRLDAVHKEVLAFKPGIGMKDPTYITENVRRYVETLAGVIAEQFESRAATPSFHGMANRLTERFHGQDISPTVRADIQNRSGNYREVWSKGRDALINSMADRAERNAVKSAFGTANLGPALDDWVTEFKKLSSGNYSKKTMQKAVSQLTFAADAYRKVVEENVSDPNIRQRFRELLDGIQLSIAKEVSFCVDPR
jgi:hypothetical protein